MLFLFKALVLKLLYFHNSSPISLWGFHYYKPPFEILHCLFLFRFLGFSLAPNEGREAKWRFKSLTKNLSGPCKSLITHSVRLYWNFSSEAFSEKKKGFGEKKNIIKLVKTSIKYLEIFFLSLLEFFLWDFCQTR